MQHCNSYGCYSQTISLIFSHALSLVFICVSLSRACLHLAAPPPGCQRSSPSRGGRVWPTWHPPRPAGLQTLALLTVPTAGSKPIHKTAAKISGSTISVCGICLRRGAGKTPRPHLLTHRLGEHRVCIVLHAKLHSGGAT